MWNAHSKRKSWIRSWKDMREEKHPTLVWNATSISNSACSLRKQKNLDVKKLRQDTMHALQRNKRQMAVSVICCCRERIPVGTRATTSTHSHRKNWHTSSFLSVPWRRRRYTDWQLPLAFRFLHTTAKHRMSASTPRKVKKHSSDGT